MADLQAHTQRWQHHRAPTFVACSTDDCHLAAYRRGMCDRHYRRALAAGELERLTPEARFWSKVEKTETCWIWRGARDDKGYGSLGINGKILRAHRVSYEWLIGPIPEGLVLDHLCRVPPCVNPAHLEPVTQGENSRRGIRGDQLRLEDK